MAQQETGTERQGSPQAIRWHKEFPRLHVFYIDILLRQYTKKINSEDTQPELNGDDGIREYFNQVVHMIDCRAEYLKSDQTIEYWSEIYHGKLRREEVEKILHEEAIRLCQDDVYYIDNTKDSSLIGRFRARITATEKQSTDFRSRLHHDGPPPTELDVQLLHRSEMAIYAYIMSKEILAKPWIYVDAGFCLFCNLWRQAIITNGPKNLPEILRDPTIVMEIFFAIWALALIRWANQTATETVNRHRTLKAKNNSEAPLV